MRKTLKDFSLLAKRWWPAVIWMALIVTFSTEAGSTTTSHRLLRPIFLWLWPGMTEPQVYDANIFVRKTMHVIQFIVLAMLVWRTNEPLLRPRGGRGFLTFLKVMGVAFVFAAGSETVQHFMKTRGASRHDVYLDMAGAGLGVLLILLLRLIFGLPSRQAPIPQRPARSPLRVLITANTRLGDDSAGTLAQLRETVVRTKPDLCVIAGDLCPVREAEHWLRELRQATGDCPLAVCLGNEDHWLPRAEWRETPNPAAVREKYWRPALEAAGVRGLDFGNVDLGGLIVSGGYGHFDLGWKPEDLDATMEHYAAGRFGTTLNEDMQRIPHAAATLEEEAARQAAGIFTRIESAQRTGKPILLVTHAAPFPKLAGGKFPPGDERGFLRAYAGNSLLGAAIQSSPQHIDLAVSANAADEDAPRKIGGIRCAGLDGEAGRLRFVLFDSLTGVELF